ncbi:hypothetical protein [Thalassobacillus sp. B23F22_16]|uniref:hypothetical protein n=1 Tax=Thalassobacillus sp. B23F22_16 TaxID=3459513 RepID=UPI00373EF316
MSNQRNKGTAKGRGGMKNWIFIVVTVIIVAGIGATAFGVMKDKDPMARYLTSEQNTIEKQMTFLESQSEQMEELEEKMTESAYHSSSTVTADFNVEEGAQSFGTMLPMIKGMVSSAKLETEHMMDPGSKETFMALDLLFQGQSLGNAEFYQNESQAALKVPFLYEDYFTLPNDQLGEFLRKHGEEAAGMEELPNLAEYQSATLTTDELDEIAKDYTTTLLKELDKDQFEMENGVRYENEKYDKVTLNLSEQESKDLIKVLLNKLKDDERIWNLVDAQMKLNMAAGDVEDGKSAVEDLEKEVDNIQMPDGFKLEAYLDGDLVAYRDINFTLSHAEAEESAAISFHTNYEEKDEAYTSKVAMEVVPSSEDGIFSFRLDENGEKSGEALHVDHDISFSMEEEGQPSTIGVTLSSVLEGASSETTFDIIMEGAAFAGGLVPELSGYINTTAELDGEKANQNLDVGIDFAMEDPMTGPVSGMVEFNITTDTEFTDTLDFPDLAETGTVNVMETSDQEMESIMQEIEMNLQKYYMDMFGNFGGLGAF